MEKKNNNIFYGKIFKKHQVVVIVHYSIDHNLHKLFDTFVPNKQWRWRTKKKNTEKYLDIP